MPAKPTGKKSGGRKTDPRSNADKLIDAALDLAATERWNDISLAAIAERAGVPMADTLTALPGRDQILAAHFRRVDTQVLNSLTDDPLDGSVKDKLFDLLMRRFDALEGRRDAVASIVGAIGRSPIALACQGRRLLKSMAITLEAAGAAAVGCRGAVRAKVLAAIYLSALRAWLKDDDPGLATTMKTLDKGLSRAEQLAGGLRRPVKDSQKPVDS